MYYATGCEIDRNLEKAEDRKERSYDAYKIWTLRKYTMRTRTKYVYKLLLLLLFGVTRGHDNLYKPTSDIQRQS